MSAASSSTSSRRISLSHPPALTSNSLGGQNSAYPSPREVVTATIELLQGGCLPGDRVPLQIMINHNKPVKSLQGIIITLYREGHVDTHPAIPLGPLQPGKKKQYEDYYPRSRTGLGGLSLLSAGTSSGFRKDLNQKIVPLIIDPKTLNAVIKTSIQVPEDLFPTISAVPGAMVTFKYNIEVVIDLRGRLTGQDRFFPRLNMIGGASKYDYNDYTGIKPDGLDSLSFPSAVPLILLNTDNARREKGVVACVFEIIVGTRDSRRKRPRQVENHQGFAASSSETSRISEENRALESIQAPYNDRAIPNTETDPQSHTDAQCTDHGAYNERTMGDLLPQMTPLPDIDEGHDEKSRITRAERWLLPSAPSEIGTHLDSDRSIPEPSAPGAYYEENYGQLEGQVGIDAPIYSKLPASSWETVIPDGRYCDYENSLQAEPRVNSSMAGAEDDKQERERRRLQMAASSPDGYECGEINGPYDQRHTIEPTAPSLNENLHLHHALHGSQHISQPNHLKLGNENLPLYQK